MKILKSSPVKTELVSVIANTEGELLDGEKASHIMSSLGFEKWLPFAAAELQISANVEDYVITPVNILISEIPNRNGISFPTTELVKWNVERGCQAYQSWKGMPMFVEHASGDHTKAIGVIVDVSLKKATGYSNDKLWKVVCLLAVDRTKNPEIARKIESGEQNTYSMGALVSGFRCSICDKKLGECKHLDKNKPMDFYELDGQLVFRKVYGISGQETSSVADPAYPVAISDHLITYT